MRSAVNALWLGSPLCLTLGHILCKAHRTGVYDRGRSRVTLTPRPPLPAVAEARGRRMRRIEDDADFSSPCRRHFSATTESKTATKSNAVVLLLLRSHRGEGAGGYNTRTPTEHTAKKSPQKARRRGFCVGSNFLPCSPPRLAARLCECRRERGPRG